MSDKPPSRERYERENPNVTFRIAREKKEKLDQMVDEMEMTKKDWIESVIDDTEQNFEAARDTAYREGFQNAREEFEVTVPCAECGEAMHLDESQKVELWRILKRLPELSSFTALPPQSTLEDYAWKVTHDECPKPHE